MEKHIRIRIQLIFRCIGFEFFDPGNVYDESR